MSAAMLSYFILCLIGTTRQSSVAKPFSEILICGDDRTDEYPSQPRNEQSLAMEGHAQER